MWFESNWWEHKCVNSFVKTIVILLSKVNVPCKEIASTVRHLLALGIVCGCEWQCLNIGPGDVPTPSNPFWLVPCEGNSPGRWLQLTRRRYLCLIIIQVCDGKLWSCTNKTICIPCKAKLRSTKLKLLLDSSLSDLSCSFLRLSGAGRVRFFTDVSPHKFDPPWV